MCLRLERNILDKFQVNRSGRFGDIVMSQLVIFRLINYMFKYFFSSYNAMYTIINDKTISLQAS